MTRRIRQLLKRATAIEVLRLEPGDVLLVIVPDPISAQDAAALRDVLTPKLPAEFVILPRSIGVEVLRPAAL